MVIEQAGPMNADNRRGILAMSLAMALFIANDALVKQVSASLPGPQLIFIRGLMATTLVLIMAQAMGHLKNWRMMLSGKLWLRGAVDAMASLTYLTAVFHLPLGNATAINLASPLFITVFAIFFFKERVTFQRGALILLGFTGPLESTVPDMAKGAELAVKEINDSGKFALGTLVTVNGDTTCVDATAATAAAEELNGHGDRSPCRSPAPRHRSRSLAACRASADDHCA